MIRWVAIMVAVAMTCVALVQLVRERSPGDAIALASAGDGRACKAIISTDVDVDIQNARERIRHSFQSAGKVMPEQIAAFETVLACALARHPTDGEIPALMAWTAWRLNAPVARIAALIEHSYRLHPFEANTIAVRQLVIAANWDRLNEDIQAIGRADQSLRFAMNRPVIVVPEVGLLYLEAGTTSDLYHEALDRIARVAPQLLKEFEGIATGRRNP